MNNRLRDAITAGLLVCVLFMGGCAPSTPAPTALPATEQPPETAPQVSTYTPTAETPPTEDSLPATEVATAEEPTFAWIADGQIAEGEYVHEAELKGFRLWWRNDSEYLYLAMEGKTEGWISIGIDPERAMEGANYLLGYVVDGEALLWDAYGTAPTGATHPPDEDLGGTNDIVAFAGIEQDAVTRFEVQIPLDSGDQYDKSLKPGERYSIIVATGNKDEYDAYHSMRAAGAIDLD